MQDAGRYRVTRRIGQGGMAEVLEAISIGAAGFERRVAIKQMLPTFATDPAFARMFLDEARIASRLHHGSIVAVLDFGVSDGVPFQILEFVDGVDARHLRELGDKAGLAFPTELALAVCTDVAHALAHAHDARDNEGRRLEVVHRDVSPANILVSWGGDVKLTDFGIAFAKNRAETTSIGVAKGTLLYMAPEQLLRGEIDGRTDLFSLGCVLHALCTGQSPLAGENAMADLIAGGELRLDPSLPDDVRTIVTRATRLSREQRYENASAMAAALGTALARRIDRDARGLLRDWLTVIRPDAEARAQQKRKTLKPLPGKLDGLLGAELVLAEQTGDQVRRFSMRRTTPEVLAMSATAEGDGGAGLPDAQTVPAGQAGGAMAAFAMAAQARQVAAARTPSAALRAQAATKVVAVGERGGARGMNAAALAAAATMSPAGGPSPTVPGATPAVDDDEPARPRRGRTMPIAIAAVLVLIAAGAWFGLRGGKPPAAANDHAPSPTRGSTEPRGTIVTDAAPAHVALAAPAVDAAPAPAPTPTLGPDPRLAVAAPAIHKDPSTTPHVRSAPPREIPVTQAPAPLPAPTPTATTPSTITSGTVLVAGGGALKAEILVDGASRGHAPMKLTLPLGNHHLVLKTSDGHEVERDITVSAWNTESAPVRVTVEK